MGTYGKPRRNSNARFIARLGIAILLGGVIVFSLWFAVLWLGVGHE